jgi:hypothetical protein
VLKYVTEGNVEVRIGVKKRQGIRRNQLMDDPKEVREEVLDRTLWRTRCGRGYGPLLDRQTNVCFCVYLTCTC